MERALKPITCLAAAVAIAMVSQTANAAGDTKTLALVVTNNRSTTLTLPDLQYADDDGARYYRLFRSAADKEGVVLLTTFDRSSAALYPDLAPIARPPTRAAVEEAVAQLAAVAQDAHKHGDKTTFYFVYAGHGDVENGRGFIDLEDGRIDGQFIENAIIEKIAADTKHLCHKIHRASYRALAQAVSRRSGSAGSPGRRSNPIWGHGRPVWKILRERDR